MTFCGISKNNNICNDMIIIAEWNYTNNVHINEFHDFVKLCKWLEYAVWREIMKFETHNCSILFLTYYLYIWLLLSCNYDFVLNICF